MTNSRLAINTATATSVNLETLIDNKSRDMVIQILQEALHDRMIWLAADANDIKSFTFNYYYQLICNKLHSELRFQQNLTRNQIGKIIDGVARLICSEMQSITRHDIFFINGAARTSATFGFNYRALHRIFENNRLQAQRLLKKAGISERKRSETDYCWSKVLDDLRMSMFIHSMGLLIVLVLSLEGFQFLSEKIIHQPLMLHYQLYLLGFGLPLLTLFVMNSCAYRYSVDWNYRSTHNKIMYDANIILRGRAHMAKQQNFISTFYDNRLEGFFSRPPELPRHISAYTEIGSPPKSSEKRWRRLSVPTITLEAPATKLPQPGCVHGINGDVYFPLSNSYFRWNEQELDTRQESVSQNALSKRIKSILQKTTGILRPDSTKEGIKKVGDNEPEFYGCPVKIKFLSKPYKGLRTGIKLRLATTQEKELLKVDEVYSPCATSHRK
jgi:hypothetical protein